MSKHVLVSPGGKVKLTITLEEGTLYYSVHHNDQLAADRAPLGLVTQRCDFTGGLSLVHARYGAIDETYTIAAFKKAKCENRANTLALTLEKSGNQLIAEGRAYDDGAAVRLIAGGEGNGLVLGEGTCFKIPPQASEVYAQKLLFCYEDKYLPVPQEDLYQNAWAMPVLVKAGPNLWALYTEAAVFGDYGGSNLQSSRETPTKLNIRRAPDKLTPIQSQYPVTTPWRVVMAGGLDTIVQSNLLENLNPPSIVPDPGFIRPGRVAWSWMTENQSPRDPQRMREYVDFAAEMDFEYSLIDAGWPGHVDIPEIVKYAAERKVKIWIWEHSSEMRTPQIAEEKFRLWSDWGVAGAKIDFFESDSQERMAQYDMLASLGAKYCMMLNFHGATKPSGESRTWPHVMTREGVMGGEYLGGFSHFLPGGPDAAHHCTLPFTRNAAGPMDFAPIVYKNFVTGTTDAHQTALGLLFTSYLLHVGEGIEGVLASPFRPFLEQLPAAWDETRLLEGYPANYVTMARRQGDSWFVGGICAHRPRNARFTADFLDKGEYEAELYADDLSDLHVFDVAAGALPPADRQLCSELEKSKWRPSLHTHDLHAMKRTSFPLNPGGELCVPMAANGGFVMYIKKNYN